MSGYWRLAGTFQNGLLLGSMKQEERTLSAVILGDIGYRRPFWMLILCS
jgi:hypothetical protein